MSWAREDDRAPPPRAWFSAGLVGPKPYQCLPEPYQSFTTILCTIATYESMKLGWKLSQHRARKHDIAYVLIFSTVLKLKCVNILCNSNYRYCLKRPLFIH